MDFASHSPFNFHPNINYDATFHARCRRRLRKRISSETLTMFSLPPALLRRLGTPGFLRFHPRSPPPHRRILRPRLRRDPLGSMMMSSSSSSQQQQQQNRRQIAKMDQAIANRFKKTGEKYNVKVVLRGDSATGKTALLRSVCVEAISSPSTSRRTR